MSGFDFYEIVTVLRTERALTLGVGGSRGIVLGISGRVDGREYAVLVGDRTYVLGAPDLESTGEHSGREAIYGRGARPGA